MGPSAAWFYEGQLRPHQNETMHHLNAFKLIMFFAYIRFEVCSSAAAAAVRNFLVE